VCPSNVENETRFEYVAAGLSAAANYLAELMWAAFFSSAY